MRTPALLAALSLASTLSLACNPPRDSTPPPKEAAPPTSPPPVASTVTPSPTPTLAPTPIAIPTATATATTTAAPTAAPTASGAPPIGSRGKCSSDADCRLFSDYCMGCDCRSLGPDVKDPTCKGPGVRCFADPCQNAKAACVKGTCALRTGATQ